MTVSVKSGGSGGAGSSSSTYASGGSAGIAGAASGGNIENINGNSGQAGGHSYWEGMNYEIKKSPIYPSGGAPVAEGGTKGADSPDVENTYDGYGSPGFVKVYIWA